MKGRNSRKTQKLLSKSTLIRWTLGVAAFLGLECALFLFVDRPVSLWFSELGEASPEIVSFFRAYTDVGKGIVSLVPSALGALACFVWWRVRKAEGKNATTALFAARAFSFVFAAVAFSGIATKILKTAIGRARPKLLEADIYQFNPVTFKHDWNSMPSGHSTTAFTVAAALFILFPNLRVLWILLGIALAASRVVINAHYLSDVVAGAAVGALSSYVVAAIFIRQNWMAAGTHKIGK